MHRVIAVGLPEEVAWEQRRTGDEELAISRKAQGQELPARPKEQG